MILREKKKGDLSMISEKLILKIRTSGEKQYALANKFGFKFSGLSQLVRKIRSPSKNEIKKILELGSYLGLTESELFNHESDNNSTIERKN